MNASASEWDLLSGFDLIHHAGRDVFRANRKLLEAGRDAVEGAVESAFEDGTELEHVAGLGWVVVLPGEAFTAADAADPPTEAPTEPPPGHEWVVDDDGPYLRPVDADQPAPVLRPPPSQPGWRWQRHPDRGWSLRPPPAVAAAVAGSAAAGLAPPEAPAAGRVVEPAEPAPPEPATAGPLVVAQPAEQEMPRVPAAPETPALPHPGARPAPPEPLPVPPAPPEPAPAGPLVPAAPAEGEPPAVPGPGAVPTPLAPEPPAPLELEPAAAEEAPAPAAPELRPEPAAPLPAPPPEPASPAPVVPHAGLAPAAPPAPPESGPPSAPGEPGRVPPVPARPSEATSRPVPARPAPGEAPPGPPSASRPTEVMPAPAQAEPPSAPREPGRVPPVPVRPSEAAPRPAPIRPAPGAAPPGSRAAPPEPPATAPPEPDRASAPAAVVSAAPSRQAPSRPAAHRPAAPGGAGLDVRPAEAAPARPAAPRRAPEAARPRPRRSRLLDLVGLALIVAAIGIGVMLLLRPSGGDAPPDANVAAEIETIARLLGVDAGELAAAISPHDSSTLPGSPAANRADPLLEIVGSALVLVDLADAEAAAVGGAVAGDPEAGQYMVLILELAGGVPPAGAGHRFAFLNTDGSTVQPIPNNDIDGRSRLALRAGYEFDDRARTVIAIFGSASPDSRAFGGRFGRYVMVGVPRDALPADTVFGQASAGREYRFSPPYPIG